MMEIRRTVNTRAEDSLLPPFEITVIVTEDDFTISDMNGAWIFRAPLDALVLQLCMMESRLAQFIMPPSE